MHGFCAHAVTAKLLSLARVSLSVSKYRSTMEKVKLPLHCLIGIERYKNNVLGISVISDKVLRKTYISTININNHTKELGDIDLTQGSMSYLQTSLLHDSFIYAIQN